MNQGRCPTCEVTVAGQPCFGCGAVQPVTATRTPSSTVAAEEAPIGVQLWPTTSPEYAPNFTLRYVAIYRGATRTYVVWEYESGTTRTFDVGEQVTVQYV